MNKLSKVIEVAHSQSRNDCGPCATAMVLGFFGLEKPSPPQTAREMRLWRVPWVGATLPRGIVSTLHRHGLATESRWFGTIQKIKTHLDRDHPVIVLVRPTDLKGTPFFSLHYRVVVGYNDNASAPGGGELFFNCSASPERPDHQGERPGNVTLSYVEFLRQWLTWTSINWYTGAYPRKAGLG
ncbi:MAG: C39 family peptidase [Chloroflexi bacterium]|nr:C39 family peptidase [Chloroflexota bacterium]